MEKKNCIIIDLEGTLTDCSHRIKFYNNKNYQIWNSLFYLDSINEKAIELIKNFLSNHKQIKIILCTAKSVQDKPKILTWLNINTRSWLHVNEFFYRPVANISPSVVLKEHMLKSILKKYNVIAAFDDRIKNCEMYETYGIQTYYWAGYNKNNNNISMTPDMQLKEFAKLFKKKNKEYGSSYKYFGKIMLALFPDGVKLSSEKDFTRFALINVIIGKIDRYSKNFDKSGHSDSLIDLSVYSAMLLTIDQIKKVD